MSIYCEKCRTRIATGNRCTTCGHVNPGPIPESNRTPAPPPPPPAQYNPAQQPVYVTNQVGASYGQPMMYPVAQAPTHGPAVASMVLGIVSLVIWYLGIVTGIVGLILGATSLKHCQPNGPKKGRGMAVAGITCSIIALSLWLIVLAAAGSLAAA